MKLFEITQTVNEVNWGAIPGALGGIAKQAMGIEPAPALPGQERRAAKQLAAPLTKQQADSMKKTWAAAVQAEMAARNVNDIRLLPANRLRQIMTSYIENRLFDGRMRIADLNSPFPTRINQVTQSIINNSADLSDPSLDQSFQELAKYIQNAMASDVFTRSQRGVAGAPAAGGVWLPEPVRALGPAPEPPQAAKKNSMASTPKDRHKNGWRENMWISSFFTALFAS